MGYLTMFPYSTRGQMFTVHEPVGTRYWAPTGLTVAIVRGDGLCDRRGRWQRRRRGQKLLAHDLN